MIYFTQPCINSLGLQVIFLNFGEHFGYFRNLANDKSKCKNVENITNLCSRNTKKI